MEFTEIVRTFASAFALKVGAQAVKKAFFEQFYINREVVVQEASICMCESLACAWVIERTVNLLLTRLQLFRLPDMSVLGQRQQHRGLYGFSGNGRKEGLPFFPSDDGGFGFFSCET